MSSEQVVSVGIIPANKLIITASLLQSKRALLAHGQESSEPGGGSKEGNWDEM